MEILILAVVGVLAIAGVLHFRKKVTKGCCASSDENVDKVLPQDLNVENYPYEKVVHIDGMHCANCARKVENAYNSLEGCLAEVNLAKKQAVVKSKEPIREAELVAIPARLGYDAKL